jgi:hypothetical protein
MMEEEEKVADISIARNKKKSREGRYQNLAQMYIDREKEHGQYMAMLWLWRELKIQGVTNMEKEADTLAKYIQAIKDEEPDPPEAA